MIKPDRVGVLAVLMWTSTLGQAAEAISTDRPDFVESSDVVGRGRVQIETGLSWDRSQGNGLKLQTQSTPTLLRVGISNSLELRLESDGLIRSSTRDTALGTTQRDKGFADAALGVKWHMQDGDEASGKPGMAWLLHADLDSGSAAFRGQGIRPSLRFVAEWDLPRDLSLGVMPGVLLDKNDAGQRVTVGILAVTLAKTWSPAWHSFVEVAGQRLASKAKGGNVVTFDLGAAYLVNDDVQLDASVFRGLTSDAPRWQWGVGVSLRF
jgi:Putative MetA-pathway of phenol degradation